MKKITALGHFPSLRTVKRGMQHLDRYASEELARMLGGIGTVTESRPLTARMAAALDDLGQGRRR
jgi:hypothetical protein